MLTLCAHCTSAAPAAELEQPAAGVWACSCLHGPASAWTGIAYIHSHDVSVAAQAASRQMGGHAVFGLQFEPNVTVRHPWLKCPPAVHGVWEHTWCAFSPFALALLLLFPCSLQVESV